jgi:hypothetical protein
MHPTEPGTLADRPDPAMRSPPVEPLAVTPAQDRTLTAFTDSQVDRASRPRNERDQRRLVALADDPQRAVPRSMPRSSMFVAPQRLGPITRARQRPARSFPDSVDVPVRLASRAGGVRAAHWRSQSGDRATQQLRSKPLVGGRCRSSTPQTVAAGRVTLTTGRAAHALLRATPGVSSPDRRSGMHTHGRPACGTATGWVSTMPSEAPLCV